jgi:archaellum biogenesis ATPase FlaH
LFLSQIGLRKRIMGAFNILEFTDRLVEDGGSQSATEKSYQCPACGSSNFKVNVKTGKWHTFGCDCADTEAGKAKVRANINPPESAEQWVKPARVAQIRHWIHRDEFGDPTVKVLRNDDGSGGRDIKQQYSVGNQWTFPTQDGERVVSEEDVKYLKSITYPYNHQKALEAIANGEKVFWVEGEPACDDLEKIGLVGVTTLGGTNALAHTRWQCLYPPEQVVICPDRDNPGIKYAKQVADAYPGASWLYAFPTSSVWRNLPEKQGADIADWIEAGATAQQIIESIGMTPSLAKTEEGIEGKEEWEIDLERKARDLDKRLIQVARETDLTKRAVLCADISRSLRMAPDRILEMAAEKAFPELSQRAQREQLIVQHDWELWKECEDDEGMPWLIPGILPAGESLMLAGEGKGGKSLLLYEMVGALLDGGEFLGLPVKKSRVLLLQLEETKSLNPRLKKKGILKATRNGNFSLIKKFDATSNHHLRELSRMIEKEKYDVVAIDSCRGMMTWSDIDENHPSYARAVSRVKRLINEAGAALIVLHHTNKNRDAQGNDLISGTKALVGEVWGTMILTRTSQDEACWERSISVRPRDGSGFRWKVCAEFPENEGFTWKWLGAMSGDPTDPKAKRRMLAYIADCPEMATMELVDHLCSLDSGLQRDGVRKALYRLADVGLLLKRTGEAKGEGRPPTFWRVNPDFVNPGPIQLQAGVEGASVCNTPPINNSFVPKPQTRSIEGSTDTNDEYMYAKEFCDKSSDSIGGLTPKPDQTQTQAPCIEVAGVTQYRTDARPARRQRSQGLLDAPVPAGDGQRAIRIGDMVKQCRIDSYEGRWMMGRVGVVTKIEGDDLKIDTVVSEDGRVDWVVSPADRWELIPDC